MAPVEIRPKRSMMFFAVLAMAMVVVSYLFLVLVAIACVYIPVQIIATQESASFQSGIVFLFGIVIAATMLWSIVPRPDKFTPPGLHLDPKDQPRLFALIESVAASLNEEMPREVYLIPDVNAWVTDRGGFAGFGARRVMGIGLPLLSILSAAQLRAILAHEFAHYYGGDTRLGPFVFKAQSSLVRTLQNMGSLGTLARFAILQIMYVVVTTLVRWCFLAFLRVINFVSRKREYRADELACIVAGPDSLIEGFQGMCRAMVAWPAYWKFDMAPMIDGGALPEVSSGFARFVQTPELQKPIEEQAVKIIESQKAEAYDSHPVFRDRIAAAKKFPSVPQAESAMARDLLDRTENLEVRWMESLNPKMKAGSLKAIAWSDVGSEVMVPEWKQYVTEYSTLVSGVTAESIPEYIPNLRKMGFDIRDPQGMLLSPEQRTNRAARLFASALGLALLANGWTIYRAPGVFHMQKGNDKLDPFAIVEALRVGKLSTEEWVARCRTLGIGALPLSDS